MSILGGQLESRIQLHQTNVAWMPTKKLDWHCRCRSIALCVRRSMRQAEDRTNHMSCARCISAWRSIFRLAGTLAAYRYSCRYWL